MNPNNYEFDSYTRKLELENAELKEALAEELRGKEVSPKMVDEFLKEWNKDSLSWDCDDVYRSFIKRCLSKAFLPQPKQED